MIHPWATFRESKGFSQQFIADQLDVSRHYVIRLEQGLFANSPDHVLNKLSDLLEVSNDELHATYHLYRHDTREEFGRSYADFSYLKNYAGAVHPLVDYRERNKLSRIGLCKGLCLHPDPINDYEKNKQRGVPRDLIVACNEISWDYGHLENAVTEWRISGRADAIRANAN